MSMKIYFEQTRAALRMAFAKKKRLGPMAYLDIYENMDTRRPEVGDEYVVTAVSDFVDPVQGKCWPLEIRRKI